MQIESYPNVKKELRRVRPKILFIYPVVFWCTAIFAVLNFLIAAGLYLWHPTANYPVVAQNQWWMTVWAILFGSVGALLTYGLISKRWEQLRAYMCLALFYKAWWAVALLLRVQDGGTFLIAALFIGLAALQAVIIIFYLPPDEASSDGTTE